MAKKSWPVMVGEYTSLAFLLPMASLVGYAIGHIDVPCGVERDVARPIEEVGWRPGSGRLTGWRRNGSAAGAPSARRDRDGLGFAAQ